MVKFAKQTEIIIPSVCVFEGTNLRAWLFYMSVAVTFVPMK